MNGDGMAMAKAKPMTGQEECLPLTSPPLTTQADLSPPRVQLPQAPLHGGGDPWILYTAYYIHRIKEMPHEEQATQQQHQKKHPACTYRLQATGYRLQATVLYLAAARRSAEAEAIRSRVRGGTATLGYPLPAKCIG
ncbi:hypothetical protein CPLU01_02504 [Colletotrichum plurivorum]|uniref:Uncharacterized protein n=1 Tax=Colletotrichum plurivorum TaxID=2175906 RepID=A0A8H6KVE3_9PEZI|nr:hypothetical protein CPLU01_02504 [Colletotrichum plurivorum]